MAPEISPTYVGSDRRLHGGGRHAGAHRPGRLHADGGGAGPALLRADALPAWQPTIVALHIEMENDLDAGITRAVDRMLALERERKALVKPALDKAARRVLAR